MTGEPIADVVVVGGGLVGCAAALHLALVDPSLAVTVVEPDPTYAFAATTRASGGIRQLFTHPENIRLSRYTLDVVQRWREFAGADAPELGWQRQGYLFIADARGRDCLRANLAVQREHGVAATWLDPRELGARFPAMRVDDLSGAVYSPDDGWLDPHALLAGTRRRAAALGVRFRRDRVVELLLEGGRVGGVALQAGTTLRAGVVVLAAGTWSTALAARAGIALPIEPMRRFEHFVATTADLRALPFVKDAAGLAVRPEGPGLSVGLVDFDQPADEDLIVDEGYFERAVWPALAHRFPVLDRLRVRSTTAGLYDQNRFDGNPVVGPAAGHADNLYLACGFSGHGLMHALGVGRAVAEHVVHGRYTTIDLTRLGPARLAAGEPMAERGIR